ncbi:MAG TPA: hypothetical protein VE377_05265 [Candidatus Dormibacteraeota bacterium]|nr:hypothetical protein [Candidatus Dormibacteraeota bacterium]
MNVMEWSKANVDYGRKLVDSALEGARTGEDEFLKEESLPSFLGESARQALAPAVVGACLGALGGYLGTGHRSKTRALVGAFLGGAVGFGAGVIWESRQFTASVASSSWKSINQTRDEHWLEMNPIDYA